MNRTMPVVVVAALLAVLALPGCARETGMTIDLQGTLEAAGFEYTLSGATVEVTLRSVTESICELVGPRLREIIDKAVGDLQSDEEREDCPDPEPTPAGEPK